MNAQSGRGRDAQAARTVARKRLTSSFSRLLSRASERAADSTCEEAEPVSVAPRCTSVMFDDTCWVPRAASCTFVFPERSKAWT